MRILVVFGTRPEAIKMAPLIKLLQKTEGLEVKICITAQHRHMLDQVMELFDLVADFDLDLMQENQSINELSSRILSNMEKILKDSDPDLILVHGDTSTTLYATLAAFNRRIKVGHVEAGLRTYDLNFPWPEESNRQIVGKLSDIHFAPTQKSFDNLVDEGVSKDKVFITGNTVIDSLFQALEIIESDINLQDELRNRFSFLDNSKKLILVTGHRRENFGESLENICDSLKQISKIGKAEIVFSVHLNPNIKDIVYERLDNLDNIHLVEPLDYLPFIFLMKQSYIILTDSGGIQEEAPSLGKPVLVMRDKTERPEALDAGTVKLVGSSKDKIVAELTKLIDDKEEYNKIAKIQNPYGDGNASERIKDILLSMKTG